LRDGFDLGMAHSILTSKLRQTRSTDDFLHLSSILTMMLSRKAGAMAQWNIELTLSCVSMISLDSSISLEIRSSSRTYHCLCRMVEVIAKRHRLRLDGHFHLLGGTLEALLTYLITQPHKCGDISWAQQPKRFSRLLELICEPSVASVTRNQKTALSSATDASKRSAGQYMYLVLMTYIKLQLEHNVPHTMREALEPGVFAIMAITTDEMRNLMNDAMDVGGRAIFKEMYRRWRQFGKWKGV